MSRARNALGAGVAAGAAVGAATAVGAVSRQRALERASLESLVEPEAYQHEPSRVLEVVAEDGVRLHVEVDEPGPDTPSPGPGAGTRPTIVLSHGYTLNLQSWVLQRKALHRAGYRVVTWDLRGHGRSEKGPHLSHDIDQLGRDLHHVLEAAVPEGPIALVGHSMGGMTIMAFGELFPDVVRERVVAAGFVGTSAGGGGLLSLGFGEAFGTVIGRLAPGLLGGLAARQRIFHGLRRIGRDVESFFVERYSFGSPVAPVTVRFAADMIFATPLDVMADFLPALDLFDKRGALSVYRGIEVLVINGQADRLTPPDHSADIVHHLPGAEHVVVSDAGHLIQLEHPYVVTEQLLELVERAARAGAAHVDVTRKPRVRRTVTDIARRRRVARARRRSAS